MTTRALKYTLEIDIDFVHGIKDTITEIFIPEHQLAFNFGQVGTGTGKSFNVFSRKTPRSKSTTEIELPDELVEALINIAEAEREKTRVSEMARVFFK